MNTTPATPKGEHSRDRLIAAALAQFGEYGLHATTRDIADQAGQNIAAITYYFGSKDELYLACARWITDFIAVSFKAHADAGARLLRQPEPDRAAIRALLHTAARSMILLLTQDDTMNLSKFISREQLSPTPAYRLIHEQVIAPMHGLLTGLIAACTRRDPRNTQTVLHAHALLGEILAFRVGRETILLRAGWRDFDPKNVALIGEVIACHIDILLDGLMSGGADE